MAASEMWFGSLAGLGTDDVAARCGLTAARGELTPARGVLVSAAGAAAESGPVQPLSRHTTATSAASDHLTAEPYVGERWSSSASHRLTFAACLSRSAIRRRSCPCG